MASILINLNVPKSFHHTASSRKAPGVNNQPNLRGAGSPSELGCLPAIGDAAAINWAHYIVGNSLRKVVDGEPLLSSAKPTPRFSDAGDASYTRCRRLSSQT